MKGDLKAVRVRSMESGDVDRVMAIAESLAQAPQWPRESYVRALSRAAEPARVALVAESRDGEVLGFAITVLVPPEAELESIAVAAGAQRQGIARQLFASLVENLKQEGITEVILEVRGSNGPGLELYRRLGFVQTGVRRGYYAEPQEDAVLMRLSLAGLMRLSLAGLGAAN